MKDKKMPEIWLIEDADECADKNGNAIPFYKFVGDTFKPSESTVRAKHAAKATLHELADLCDQDAETMNAHDYAGVHRLLGTMMLRVISKTEATRIMRHVAEHRGLHGMNGLCGNSLI